MIWRQLSSSVQYYNGFRYSGPQLRGIRTQPRRNSEQYAELESPNHLPGYGIATPRELAEYLDQFVVGQENAKKVLSVAVFNHYNRVRANLGYLNGDEHDSEALHYTRHPIGEDMGVDPEASGIHTARVRPLRKRVPLSLKGRDKMPLFEKSNVLVLGPTGSGKTLLARTLAKILDVPFSVSDATSFTQVGRDISLYALNDVGEDVDMAVQRLVQAANWDPVRASTGIIYIDEIDKISRRSSSGTEGSRDVGGEGVQQALLRMMEGSIVTVQAKGGASTDITPQATGDPNARGPQRPTPHVATPKSDVYYVDTTNVLFILSGAFVGLDKIIKQRVAKGSIGFTANLPSEKSLPFFTPNRTAPENPLDRVETSDLVSYGFIPEFVSRLPSITTLAPLTIPDLRRILTEVKGSLVSQYTALFGYSGVEIRFTSGALDEICKKAYDRGGGARGLRGIMEALLLDPMYEVPGTNISHVLITADTVLGLSTATYWKKGRAVHFWEAWATEEGSYSKRKS